MKISKLFHWLYAILMFLPFGLVVFNALASMCSGNIIDYTIWYGWITDFTIDFGVGLYANVYEVYFYLCNDLFGIDSNLIISLLSYWTSISIIWLVFDVFMYVPLLVHRWIDKAKIE